MAKNPKVISPPEINHNSQNINDPEVLDSAFVGPPSPEAQKLKNLVSDGKISGGLFSADSLQNLDFSDPGSDSLQIGDMFFRIPPTAISIQKSNLNYKYETLRTKSSSKAKSGRSQANLLLELYFVGKDQINRDLRRLIAMFKNTPFAYIDNAFVRANLAPWSLRTNQGKPVSSTGQTQPNMAVSLIDITFSSVSFESSTIPDAIRVNLNLGWFNYSPYTPNFSFRKSFPKEVEVTGLQSLDTGVQSKKEVLDQSLMEIDDKEQASMDPGRVVVDKVFEPSSPVSNPIDSELFKGYLDSILGDSKKIPNVRVATEGTITFAYKEIVEITNNRLKLAGPFAGATTPEGPKEEARQVSPGFYSARDPEEYAYIEIESDDGRFTTVYGHLRASSFSAEDIKRNGPKKIKAGEIIGLSGGGVKKQGNTIIRKEPGSARTGGAHLHFEIKATGKIDNIHEDLAKIVYSGEIGPNARGAERPFPPKESTRRIPTKTFEAITGKDLISEKPSSTHLNPRFFLEKLGTGISGITLQRYPIGGGSFASYSTSNISSEFGTRYIGDRYDEHYGVDLKTTGGLWGGVPVVAAHNGRITKVIGFRNTTDSSVGVDSDGASLSIAIQNEDQERLEIKDVGFPDDVRKGIIDDMAARGWIQYQKVDPFLTNDMIFYRYRTVSVRPISISSALHNSFTYLPLLGQQYATQQFVGSNDSEMVFSFISVGKDKMQEFQGMVDMTEQNANKFRRLKDAGVIDIISTSTSRKTVTKEENERILKETQSPLAAIGTNEFASLLGIRRVLVEDINAESMKNQADTYHVQVQLTQFGTDNEVFTKHNTDKTTIYKKVVERLKQSFFVFVESEAFDNTFAFDLDPNRNLQSGPKDLNTFIDAFTDPNLLRKYVVSQTGSDSQLVEEVKKRQLPPVFGSSDWERYLSEVTISAQQAPSTIQSSSQRDLRSTTVLKTSAHSFNVRLGSGAPVFDINIDAVLSSDSFLTIQAGKLVELMVVASLLTIITPLERPPAKRGNGELADLYGFEDFLWPWGSFPFSKFAKVKIVSEPLKASLTPLTKQLLNLSNPDSEFLLGLLKRNYPRGMNSVKEELRQVLALLSQIWFASDGLELLGLSATKDSKFSLGGTLAYPDLDLPLLEDGNALDANFYFWDLQEDSSALNLEKFLPFTKGIARRAYTTFSKLTSDKYYKNAYLNRNKDSITEDNLFSNRYPKFTLMEAYPSLGFLDKIAPTSQGRSTSSQLGEDIKLLLGEGLIGGTVQNELGKSFGINAQEIFTPVKDQDHNFGYSHTVLGSEMGGLLFRSVIPNPIDIGEVQFGAKDERNGNFLNGEESVIGFQDISVNGLSDIVQKSIETLKLQNDLMSMRRAFPTFKVFFGHEQVTDEAGRYFDRIVVDDLYGYGAVQDVRVIRSRKIPADLAVVTLTNTSGFFNNKVVSPDGTIKDINGKPGSDEAIRFPEDVGRTVNGEGEEQTRGPGRDDTGVENIFLKSSKKSGVTALKTWDEDEINKLNPYSNVVMQPGQDIQIRLGYHNDPDSLETVFTGKVVEIEMSGDSNLIQLVCQSYAVELTYYEKARDMDKANALPFDSTQHLLSAMVCQPEMRHFGRWEKTPTSSALPINEVGRDSEPSLLTSLLTHPLEKLKKEGKDFLAAQFGFLDKSQDDNIFAPARNTYQTWLRALKSTVHIKDDELKYILADATIWDVFYEMTLRHPGWVAYPTIYGNRMSMFFGLPHFNYYSRPFELFDRRDIATTQGKKKQLEKLKKFKYVSGQIKSFRDYHIATSEHNIIANNIRATEKDVYNAYTVSFYDDSDSGDTLAELQNAKTSSVTIKLDDNIADENVRMGYYESINCRSEFMARRYGISLLLDSLKNVYKGSLTLTGNPYIKPHDIITIFDSYTDMAGPIGVEQVTHIFTRDQGFITEVIPDMMVTANEYSTAPIYEAVKYASGVLWDRFSSKFAFAQNIEKNVQRDPDAAALIGTTVATHALAVGVEALAVAPTATFAALTVGGAAITATLLGGLKFLRYTQDRQPVIITPLMLSSIPYVAGIDGYKEDGVMEHFFGELEPFWLPNGKYKKWVNAVVNDSTGSILDSFYRIF